MEITKTHIIMLSIALLVVASSFFFRGTKFFALIIGAGILVGLFPFILSLIIENKEQNEKEEMFIEFSRSLVESVKTGTPISKSIVNLRGKDFGILTQHINKLANQIAMGIQLSIALKTFSRDLNNKVVSRAITLIGQAEKAGGEIGQILEAVTEAVIVSDKLKKERRAAISSLVVQGYIIFIVFIIIILVMQFKILPMVSDIALEQAGSDIGFISVSSEGTDQLEVSNAFFYLLIVQGFFSGLAVGELSEGRLIAGLKHSAALITISFIIWQAAAIYFSSATPV